MPGGGEALIREAQAVVTRQAQCSMSFALALLEATAGAKHESLECLAAEVLDGRYSFEPRLTAPPRRRRLVAS
jgi:hypothetical protein